MTEMPDLRVVPLQLVRPHEETDPLRVERLAGRISNEGTQLNPVVCIEAPGGELVLLDGATRTASLLSLGLTHVVVQVVPHETVILETWHHVVGTGDNDLIEGLRGRETISLTADGAAPRVVTPDGERWSVMASELSPNRALSVLVTAYMGKCSVNRVIDPDPGSVTWRFPQWSAIVEFPALTIDDVIGAALGNDLLPAGITRFVVPDRALRLSFDIEGLRPPGTTDEKQNLLDAALADRAGQGRIRRYEEPVIILDD